MSAGGGPVGRREVAVRCFAAEYDDATLEYSEGDEERAPNYVVTPTGARVNRLFVVGVLTEVESVSDGVLRGRVVDPTGAFVVYAGQYQPDARAALERTETPAFVAMTGKARTFRPDDGDRVYTSVRPESVNVVDAETRDRWTVQAADQTLARVRTAAAALDREERGGALTEVLVQSGVDPALAAGIPRAIEHYGTTTAYLAAVRTMALQAAEVVAGERDEVDPLGPAPDEEGAVDVDLAGDVAIEATTAEPAATPAETAETGSTGVDDEAGDVGAPADAEPVGSADDDTTGDEDAAPAEVATGELYEMDDDERESVEAEYGTEFETGNEVDGPGEADIEPPGPDDAAVEGDDEEQVDEGQEGETGGPDDGGAEPAEPEAGEAEAAEPGAGDADEGDLVDAAVAAMAELDDGDGADRDAVVASVVEARGVDEAAVEDAIQEALMGGRCYEPDDGRLKAI